LPDLYAFFWVLMTLDRLACIAALEEDVAVAIRKLADSLNDDAWMFDDNGPRIKFRPAM